MYVFCKLLTPSRYADGGLSIQDPNDLIDPGKRMYGDGCAAGVAVAWCLWVFAILGLTGDLALNPSPEEATEFARTFYDTYEPKGANHSILREFTRRFVAFLKPVEEVLEKIASFRWDGAGNRADVLLGIADAARNYSPQARAYADKVLEIQHSEYNDANARMEIRFVGGDPPSRGQAGVLSYKDGMTVCTAALGIYGIPRCTRLSPRFAGNRMAGKDFGPSDIEVTGPSFECRQWLRATAAFAGDRSHAPETARVITAAIDAIKAEYPSLTLEAAAAKASLSK